MTYTTLSTAVLPSSAKPQIVPSQPEPAANDLETLTTPDQARVDFLDNALREDIVEMEDLILSPNGRGGEPLIELISRVHNGNPKSNFIFAALRARGVAVDQDPKEALRHFEYADRMGVTVPTAYTELLEQSREPAWTPAGQTTQE